MIKASTCVSVWDSGIIQISIFSGTDDECPLPKPKSAAADLKKLTLETIQIWNNKFAADYKKLGLGYNYLKECKKVVHQIPFSMGLTL